MQKLGVDKGRDIEKCSFLKEKEHEVNVCIPFPPSKITFVLQVAALFL